MVRWYKSSIVFIFKRVFYHIYHIKEKRKRKKAHSIGYGDFSLPPFFSPGV